MTTQSGAVVRIVTESTGVIQLRVECGESRATPHLTWQEALTAAQALRDAALAQAEIDLRHEVTHLESLRRRAGACTGGCVHAHSAE